MIDIKKHLLLLILLIATPNLLAEAADDLEVDLMGTVWQLVKMALQAPLLVVGKLYIFYPVMLITPIGVENFKLGILFLW